MKQGLFQIFTIAGIKNYEGNVGSYVLVTVTGLSQHCYIHVLYFNAAV